MELEVWPSLLRCVDEAGVPQVILNGRVSRSSFERYKKIRWWLPEFDRIDLVATQDEVGAERMALLGVPPERLHVTGNLKHDLIGSDSLGDAEALGRSVGLADRTPVFVAGSTHDGEDAAVVRAWLAAGGPEVAHLVLVPRHLTRLKDIGRLLGKLDTPFVLRSEAKPDRASDRVLLVDTMGELENFFELADLVFLGGSLTPVGGHNVLEPAASACPVIVGPHIETCRREAEILAAAGGLEVLSDENAFVAAVARLLSDASERERMGRAARQALLGLQGATEANLHLLRSQGLLRGSALDRSGECSTLSRPSSAPMVDPEGHNTTYMRVGSSAGLSNGSPAGLSLSPRSGVHLP
jgi:3-deoxy-D-manno-octulosonic-acid transferase